MSLNHPIFDGPPLEVERYDICLEFPTQDGKLTAVADDVVDELVELAGADYVYMYYSSKKSLFKTEIRVNVLIRVKMKLIKHKAEADEYRLMLDAYAAQQMAYEGDPDAFVDSFQIPHLPEISTIAPFEYIYAPYVSTPEQQDLYDRPRGMQHPFHKLVRVKLFQRLLTSGRDSLSPDFLQQGGVVLDYFPVHDRDLLKSLGNSWLTLCSLPWSQPFNSVKDYFGEQVGIFFYFLGVLSLWATPLTLVGLGLQVLALYYWDFHRAELPAFALLLALFLPILLTRWSRAQQILAMKWDMTGSTDRTALSDPIRYAFYGVRTKSYIDGSDTIYFPRIRRRGLYLVSALFCILAGLLCLITTGAVFYARNELREYQFFRKWDLWLFPAAISGQIMIANRVLYWICGGLTGWENHRHDADYEISMVLKLSLLQFLNASSSFFYLAFAATEVPDSNQLWNIGKHVRGANEDIQDTLMLHLLVVISTQLLGTALSYWLPYVWRAFAELRREGMCGWDNEPGCLSLLWGRHCVADPDAATLSLCGSEGVLCGPRGVCGGAGWCCGAGGCCGTGGLCGATEDKTGCHLGCCILYIGPHAQVEERKEDAFDAQMKRGGGGRVGGRGLDARGRPISGRFTPDKSLMDRERGGDRGSLESAASADSMQMDPRDEGGGGEGKGEEREEAGMERRGGMEDREMQREEGEGGEGVGEGDIEEDAKSVDWLERELQSRAHSMPPCALTRSYARVLQMAGLVLCFGSVLPGSTLLLLLLLRVESRGRAWQLLSVFRRTVPREAEGVGAWVGALTALGVIAIGTNAALVSFLFRQFDHYPPARRLALWVGIVTFCALFWGVLVLFSGVPGEVRVQEQRSTFIVSKLVHRRPDEIGEHFAKDLL